MKRQHRLSARRSPSVLSKSNHIVEDNLDRKSQLLDRYQNDIQDRIEQMGNQQQNRRAAHLPTERKSLQRSRLSSNRKPTLDLKVGPSSIAINDHQKLILGLEYSLQSERKKVESLQNNNASLQTEISNLRNILLGFDGQKQYENTMVREYQNKITSLEEKLLQQKTNYEYILDSKNEEIASLQFQLRTLNKKVKPEEQDTASSRKMLQLLSQIEQLRSTLTKKNIQLEKLQFYSEQSESDDSQQIKIKMGRLQFYEQQFKLSNKLILRKNMQILNLSKKKEQLDQVLTVMECYLDKKEVKNVDLSILEHVCVNKLRILMRERTVMEKELLHQLNEANQKTLRLEQQLAEKNEASGSKVAEVISDNKRLTALISTLQNNIRNLEKTLDDERRETEIQRNQIEINKKQFVEEVRRMKEELTTISSVTKNEFDRMKIENLKLSEQNRSLLFLVGQKEKEIHKKGEAIRTFEDYKQKINNLDVAEPQRRKIQNVAEETPQMGTKLLLISTFSNWLIEWNKVRNWNNKKVLLNLILDKPEIREDSLKSMNYLVNVFHQTFLNSKNIDVQERAIILLSYYIKYDILKNPSLHLNKMSPIVLRGFRTMLEGEDEQKLRLLNEAALKILSTLQQNDFKWTQQMTNEMLSVNGLKYLFGIITNSQVDELVQSAYNCLTMISKQNEMISFMNSYNVTTIILNNANTEYPFLLHVLQLLRSLLHSQDYIKSQNSLLQFKKIYSILKNTDDPQPTQLTLDCALLLMDNSLFVKSLNKIEIISILAQTLRNQQDYAILKKIGEVYQIIVTELENQNVPKIARELDKLLDIVNTKKYNENRFNRAIRIILAISELLIDSKDLDQKIVKGVSLLYESYDSLEAKTKIKLNNIISVIYERNREAVNKFSNESWILNLVEAYKSTSVNEQLVFLLRILLFQHEQRKSTQILRSGRQALLSKHINDALIPDYSVALAALKNLAAISKQKYADKFVNKALFSKIVNKILSCRGEQQYMGTAISILYHFCKSQQSSITILECGLVERVFALITERQDKQNLVYKCLSLIQLCHTTNYKRKILNYLLSSDSNLAIIKTLNSILKKAKNKQEMGTRAVFIYDFLNGKTPLESFALLVEQNTWMVDNLIELRNEYVGKVDSLVYKIELLLHNISLINAKVRKVYEKFKIEGEYESEDDR